ncbi:hypothetical protein DQ04_00551120 [Trypanosoma grayi]|uniref:hypothetical protein n=1 Tax=Trypanosoma grayi TaxID=71804 RepID=UPI0004F489D1|nr:hypothetical protein DQ04_00551120 [Trypanosoma grayi]KEG14260.1 hypothetical protein DQ04_00551120 [Trypanosoma grayi]
MRCTTYTVDVMRRFCDGCNTVIAIAADPLRRLGHRIAQESPWVVVMFVSSGIAVFPLILYPVLKPYLMNDTRWIKEEERVRLCLQKGIDPYPYMRHKDYVFGNVVPATQSEEEAPLSASWEHRAMLDFQRAKEELRKEVGGNVEDSVAKLMALRAELRREFERNQHTVSSEPKNLIFRGRKDVDTLKS